MNIPHRLHRFVYFIYLSQHFHVTDVFVAYFVPSLVALYRWRYRKLTDSELSFPCLLCGFPQDGCDLAGTWLFHSNLSAFFCIHSWESNSRGGKAGLAFRLMLPPGSTLLRRAQHRWMPVHLQLIFPRLTSMHPTFWLTRPMRMPAWIGCPPSCPFSQVSPVLWSSLGAAYQAMVTEVAFPASLLPTRHLCSCFCGWLQQDALAPLQQHWAEGSLVNQTLTCAILDTVRAWSNQSCVQLSSHFQLFAPSFGLKGFFVF